MIVTVICTISILAALGGFAWYQKRLLYIHLEEMDGGMADIEKEIKKMWVISANITNGLTELTKSLDEYRAEFKLTFDNKFARNVEELVAMGEGPKNVMRKVVNGKEVVVPIDAGY